MKSTLATLQSIPRHLGEAQRAEGSSAKKVQLRHAIAALARFDSENPNASVDSPTAKILNAVDVVLESGMASGLPVIARSAGVASLLVGVGKGIATAVTLGGVAVSAASSSTKGERQLFAMARSTAKSLGLGATSTIAPLVGMIPAQLALAKDLGDEVVQLAEPLTRPKTREDFAAITAELQKEDLDYDAILRLENDMVTMATKGTMAPEEMRQLLEEGTRHENWRVENASKRALELFSLR